MEKFIALMLGAVVVCFFWSIGGLVTWLLIEAVFRKELVEALFGPAFGFWQGLGLYLLLSIGRSGFDVKP